MLCASARLKDNASNGDRNVWQTIRVARIHNIQPFCSSMVYEGCPIICDNGKVCELEKYVKRERRCYKTLPDNTNRKQDEHVCVPIERGVPMFNFIVEIDDLGNVDVFKGAGTELLGMSGREWDS